MVICRHGGAPGWRHASARVGKHAQLSPCGQQSALEEILAEKLKDDQDFAAKVQRLVDDLQKGGGGRTAFDQRGQTVHGSQTNIAGNVNGPVLSGNFSGPVNTDKSK